MLGIVGIILCVLFISWILAIICGAIAINQCSDAPTGTGTGTGTGLAIAGALR
jgi:hypothetical protein